MSNPFPDLDEDPFTLPAHSLQKDCLSWDFLSDLISSFMIILKEDCESSREECSEKLKIIRSLICGESHPSTSGPH